MCPEGSMMALASKVLLGTCDDGSGLWVIDGWGLSVNDNDGLSVIDGCGL
jgi:hypothetical protein